MSPCGPKPTCENGRSMSAIEGKADMPPMQAHVGIDCLHRNAAEDWRNVRGNRVTPLLTMFFVFPAYFMRTDVSFGALIEGDRTRCSPFLGSCSSLRSKRAPPAFLRASPRLTLWKPPNPISRALPFSMKRKVQLFEPLRPTRKLKSGAVRIKTRLAEPAHCQRCQSLNFLGHLMKRGSVFLWARMPHGETS